MLVGRFASFQCHSQLHGGGRLCALLLALCHCGRSGQRGGGRSARGLSGAAKPDSVDASQRCGCGAERRGGADVGAAESRGRFIASFQFFVHDDACSCYGFCRLNH